MSYDISFKVKVQDVDAWVEVGGCNPNITWNVRDIITKSTGLEWNNNENNGLVKDVIPHIQAGLEELKTNRQKYKKYESPNGWGTIEGVMGFFTYLLDGWKSFQFWHPDLVDVVTFWIE